MPHGTPDWGVDWAPRTVRGLDDLGEHAVRLGSPNYWDRRGDTLLAEDFDSGLGCWLAIPGGLGASVELESATAYHGVYSVKLTAGSAGVHDAVISYRHGLPFSSRLGIEFTFTLAAQTEYVRWRIGWHIGLDVYLAEVRYDRAAQTLDYRIGGAAWTIFAPTVDLYVAPKTWHTGKLVADFARFQFARFIMNGTEYPLENIPLYNYPAPAAEWMYFDVAHIGVLGNNPEIFVDCVILTQNEP